jgi:acetoin utilization protein AcuB
MRDPYSVAAFMTHTPLSIGKAQSLAAAHALMDEHRIRHLPVVDGTSLVGMISLGDVRLVEGSRRADPATISVVEAMHGDVYTVAPTDALCQVADVMAARAYSSALVVDGEQVVGILTTVDLCRALAEVLRGN